MTSTMTRQEAQGLREARDQEVGHLSRKPKYELVAIYQSEGGYGGGTWSKQDLLSSILELRYPMARQNEAIHVLHHDVTWPDCPFCQARRADGEAPEDCDICQTTNGCRCNVG